MLGDLGNLNERRDMAIHETNTAKNYKERIEQQIILKTQKIATIDKQLVNKKKEDKRTEKEHQKNVKGRENYVVSLATEKKTLTRDVNLLKKTEKKLKPIEVKFNKLETAANKAFIDVEKANNEAENTRIKTKKILDDAKKIEETTIDREKKADKHFSGLQKLEDGLRFFYERIRKWYQDKGLKLPEHLHPDKILKKYK